MQSVFVPLTLEHARAGRHPRALFADAFSACGGWALEEAFETADRQFSPQELENAAFAGGAEIRPRAMTVFGSIHAAQDGTASMHDIAMDVSASPDEIMEHLTTMFYRADLARSSGYFTDDDQHKVRAEIRDRGSLSHGWRKTCHLVCTDIVMRHVRASATAGWSGA